MALTPEDVVNKRFNATKFREGYDQDEVDDFLDEVVVELRRLNQENDEFRQRLIASDARINELQRGGAVAAEPTAAAVAAPEPVAAPAATASAVSVEDSTNNLLSLARQVHDQHIREGAEQRDAMIAEGTSKRDELIAEGRETASRLVSEAQQTSQAQIARLQEQKTRLEREISTLENFESEYRTKLKSYIEGQLAELEATQTVAERPSAAPSAAVRAEPAVFPIPPVPNAELAAAPAGHDAAQQVEGSGLPGRS